MTGRAPYPLTPFVDIVPVPPRRLIAEPARLTIPLTAARHRFHRDLPASTVWTYDGVLPGPTFEVERGVRVEVEWDNRLEGTLPVIDTLAPDAEVDGVPVQCLLHQAVGRSLLPAAPAPHRPVLGGFGDHRRCGPWLFRCRHRSRPSRTTRDSPP